LAVEPLEARDVPASFGVPFGDPTHISLSFAPDGTTAAHLPSRLTQVLDAQMPRTVWQREILRAAKTWSAQANIDIGVVADSGEPFGTVGATQSDERFGDIRIGALPMASDALGAAIPADPLFMGTFAGDVFFNTEAKFTPKSLYSVALHEIGHALGLGPSKNPSSVMFNRYGGRTALSASDVIAIRSLYGPRVLDETERNHGNASFKRSTRLDFPSSYDGQTPLVAFGNLHSRADIDAFEVRNLSDYSGPITFRVQTDGLSLIAPRLGVYDERGQRIARIDGAEFQGEAVSYTLPASERGSSYFLRIEDAPRAMAGIGRYGVGVTFDHRVEPLALSLDEVLRGPFDSLEESDIAELFRDPDSALYDEDGGSDDNPLNATELKAVLGPVGFSRFTATASLTNAADVDFYEVRAPRVGGRRVPLALTTSIRALGPNGTTPSVEIFDRDLNPVAAEVLVNGNGVYTVQVPAAESDRQFLIRLSGSQAGNFALEAGFRRTPAQLQLFAEGSATADSPTRYKLYIARTGLFGFNLAATGPVGAAARMTITSQSSQTVFDLTAQAGQTLTAQSTFLAPGEYTVVVRSVGSTDPVAFRVRGAVESDPIGPQASTSALAPQYQDPTKPGQYSYPNGQVSLIPFLWAVLPFG
jgi:hypothetical protein